MSMAHLPLWFDAPLQSWGFDSRFQRRATSLFPTKSGVIGLVCAAMGVGKGSEDERRRLPHLAELAFTVWQFPRQYSRGANNDLLMLRLMDFHTVRDTRTADNKPNPNPVVTHREYLLDARFGIRLSGDAALLQDVSVALRNPRWGVWFGRKSCLPAAPIHIGGPFVTELEAWNALLIPAGLSQGVTSDRFSRMEEVSDFALGTDTFNDQPLSYGTENSSGVAGREFAPRRVKFVPRLA